MTERFPDKRRPTRDYDQATSWIKRTQGFNKERAIEQEHATWLCEGEFPELPVAITFVTDIHYGSLAVDYDLLNQHMETVVETPNMFMLMGGDLVDAFNPIKHAKAMRGDALPVEEQIEAIMDRVGYLDQIGKLGGVQLGNHDDFVDVAGIDFVYFLRELQCPVFTGAGDLDVVVQGQNYRIFWSHAHWGNSKLNPTNACKRAIEHSSPEADLVFLGHTHQSTQEHFDRAGIDRGGIVGGTYKLNDSYGRKWGMGKVGSPGHTVLLWPGERHFEMVRDPQFASDYLKNAIQHLDNENYVNPYTQSLIDSQRKK